MSESHAAQGTRAFFWMASLIVGGLLFGLGIMVGRSMTTDQNPMATSVSDPLQQIDHRDREPLLPKTDLVYPQALSGPPSQPAKTPVVAVPASEDQPAQQIDRQPAQDAAAKSTNHKTVPPQERVELPKSEDSYCLQLASFQKLTQAQQMISSFEKKGYSDLRVVTAEVAGKGRYYRVRMGRFPDKANADAFVKQKALTAFVLKCSD